MDAHFATSFDGLRVAYYVLGEGAPLVLSTGIGVDHAGMWPQIQHFARSRRVIAWDYRGVGRSQPLSRSADVSVGAHARDLAAVLDAAEARTADLLGWSMGVPVALELVRREPARARSLILCCGVAAGLLDQLVGHPGTDALASRLLPRTAEVLHRPLGRVLRWAERSPSLVPVATRIGMIAHDVDRNQWLSQVRSVADSDLHAYIRTMAALTAADVTEVLPQIAVPTLVVAAQRDRAVPLRTMQRLAAAITGAELLVVPGASHYCVIEQPEFINLNIAAFLEKVDQSSY